jgi:hypothetical protein
VTDELIDGRHLRSGRSSSAPRHSGPRLRCVLLSVLSVLSSMARESGSEKHSWAKNCFYEAPAAIARLINVITSRIRAQCASAVLTRH